MKNWFNITLLIGLVAVLLWSCEKDETRVVAQSGRSIQYTNEELNQIALVALGLNGGTAGQVEARVKATVSPKLAAVYSNVVPITLTPYVVLINYPSLWVPGDHQGWTPATADKLSSVLDNGIYEGFVYIGGGNLKFKFTSHPDWDHTNYGWNSDQDLTFDTATKTWSITLDLVAGEIKFRANDDWAINFGDDGADASLEYNGANIAISESGNYTITLDLSTPGYYSYKVVKN